MPKDPDGVAFGCLIDVRSPVRKMMLVGPLRAAYRRLVVTGTGAGSNRVEFQFMAAAPGVRSASFSSWLVLRVPHGRNALRVAGDLEVDVRLGGTLRSLVGQHRVLRDSGHWDLALPEPEFKTPARRD